MRKVRLALVFCLLGLLGLLGAVPPAAFGQARRLDGKVIDQQTQEPLAGANVVAAPTAQGATTDRRGHFSLSVPRRADSLAVSYVGYATERLALPSLEKRRSLIVALQPSRSALAPLVVEDARSRRRRDVDEARSVGRVSPAGFARTNPVFLQDALDQIAGVSMDVRSTASQSHILIRGVGGKSRFSERGIKVYLDGIPLSDADGTTSLDFVDFTTLDRTRVLKGPSATRYGSNTGGVVQLKTERAPHGEQQAYQSLMLGQYGLLRTNTGAKVSLDAANLFVNYGYQNLDGYRDHAASEKKFLTLSGDIYAGERQTYSFLVAYTDRDDQFAGEVDRATFRDDPRSAFFIYEDRKIGNESDNLLAGLTGHYLFTPRFSNSTTLFAGNRFVRQPIEPFYSRSNGNKYGARSVFEVEVGGKRPLEVDFGGEYIRNRGAEQHYAISDEGEAGAINSDLATLAQQSNLFADAEWDLTDRATLTAGTGLNWVNYDFTDRFAGDDTNSSGERSFDPVLTPRVGLVYRLNSPFSAYAGLSTGFSPPTISEMSLPDGSVNEDVDAERSLQYEIGTHGALLDGRLNLDVSLFYLTLQDQLIRQELEPGFAGFVNAGESKNIGGEAQLSYAFPVPLAGLPAQVRPFASCSYNAFTFEDYVRGGTQYEGNTIPGTAPHRLHLGVDVDTHAGLALHATYAYVDGRALDDGNDVYTDGYARLDLRANYARDLGEHFRVKLFAGVRNLTDALYSPIVAVNQEGFEDNAPRYFNPAPGRSFYGNVTLGYRF